jgi:tetratricopeptide (TPR) repeat protein
MRTLASLFLSLALTCAAFAQHEHGAPGGSYGSVHFPTSCAPVVQPEFERAVAILHSFGYVNANRAFRDVAEKDPNCAMAWWGVAMTEYHGLWAQIWEKEGKAAIEKARAILSHPSNTGQRGAPVSHPSNTGGGAPTARERAYIDAIGTIFDDTSQPLRTRSLAYEAAMDKLRTAYPDDTEATIFYALALDVDALKDDKTYANQRQARDLLVPLFDKHPDHPGLAHYIIHVSDFPPLAAGALGAARRYAQIAPASAHAQHMPSHIFTRLGLWDESIASNLASAASAKRDDSHPSNAGQAPSTEAFNQRLHALDYLEYAYLQQGKWDKARAIAELARTIRRPKDLDNIGAYADAAVPARYALERRDWKAAASLVAGTGRPIDDAMTVYANGVGTAMLRDNAGAAKAAATLAAYRDKVKPESEYWSQQIEIQRLQVVAWSEFQDGKREEGLRHARAAADLEDALEKDPVTPGPIVPARENLAEMLLQAGQLQPARAEFQAVLKVAPGRYNAMAGLKKSRGTADAAKLDPQR